MTTEQETGRQLRADGEAAVIAADQAPYRDAAKHIDAAIVELAGTGRPFTAEDVRARVGGIAIVQARMSEAPNLLPALMSAASNRGLIRHIGWAESTRPSARSRAIRLWEGVQTCAA